MRHAVLEGVPEGRVGEQAGLVSVDFCLFIRRGGSERGRQDAAKPVDEIGEILLSRRAQGARKRHLLATRLVVARAGHVRLAGGDGRQLVEKLLGDGLVPVLTVEPVVRLQDPVVRVPNVTRMHDEVVLVDVVTQTADGGVVERRVDEWDQVPFGLVLLDRVPIFAVDAEVDHDTDVEGCFVTRQPRAGEGLERGVRGDDLVVVGGGGVEAVDGHHVGPGARCWVGDGGGRAGLLAGGGLRCAILDTRLAKLLVGVPGDADSCLVLVSALQSLTL